MLLFLNFCFTIFLGHHGLGGISQKASDETFRDCWNRIDSFVNFCSCMHCRNWCITIFHIIIKQFWWADAVFTMAVIVVKVDQTAFIVTSIDNHSGACVGIVVPRCASVVVSQYFVPLESAGILLCSLPSLVFTGLRFAASRSGNCWLINVFMLCWWWVGIWQLVSNYVLYESYPVTERHPARGRPIMPTFFFHD